MPESITATAPEVAATDYSQAACRGHDPELFFPERPVGRTGEQERAYWAQLAAAKAVCAGCPLRAQCLEDHLFEPHGVFGGMTADKRAKVRRAAGRFKVRVAYDVEYSTTAAAEEKRRYRERLAARARREAARGKPRGPKPTSTSPSAVRMRELRARRRAEREAAA